MTRTLAEVPRLVVEAEGLRMLAVGAKAQRILVAEAEQRMMVLAVEMGVQTGLRGCSVKVVQIRWADW